MYHQLWGYSVPTFAFYIVKAPSILITWIIFKMKGKTFDDVKERYRIVNEVRRTCLYYCEKDKQLRVTLSCAYKMKDYVITIRLRFHKKAKKQDYENFRETLETHTCNVSAITYKKGYAYFSVILENPPLYEFESSRVDVSIGTGSKGLFKWDWVSYPHMLVIGETGQGKSVFMRYVLNGLFSYGHEVWCIDGKVIDYAKFENSFKTYVPNSATDKKKILDVILRFRAYMKKRLEDMQKLGIYEYQENEDLQPKFLLIEEWIAIVETMTKEERKIFDECITEIALLGRATGYILIGTLQRGDVKFISGALRDNFMVRVVLGTASADSYKMMFEKVLTGFKKGVAWCMLGNQLHVIRIPFFKEIVENRKILEEKERFSKKRMEEEECFNE